MLRLFAVSAPGLKPYVTQELAGLGLLQLRKGGPGNRQGGGVRFKGNLEHLYRANLHLRSASRVLVRLGSFHASAFWELQKRAARLSWERYLRPGQAVAFRVTSQKSRLYHTGAIEERLTEIIAKRLGSPIQVENFSERNADSVPQLIVMRIVRDDCTISIDSSGEGLYRRGYRLATAKAPLRETLAAGMILASGWDRSSPLVDPLCGSGTIPIEAALLASGKAPGASRQFAFMGWPDYDPNLWERLVEEAQIEPETVFPSILGSDRDAGAVQIAEENAVRAGMSERIFFSHRAISAIDPPPGPGWVITNPPYGVRVSPNKDLRNLYAQLGNVLRENCPGWRIAILSSDMRLIGQTGFTFEEQIPMVNGGVAVKLALGRVN